MFAVGFVVRSAFADCQARNKMPVTVDIPNRSGMLTCWLSGDRRGV